MRETRDFEPMSKDEIIHEGSVIVSWKGGLYVVVGFSIDSENHGTRVHYRPVSRPRLSRYAKAHVEIALREVVG